MKILKPTIFTLLLLSSTTVYSNKYNIVVKLDEISNKNINHVGNEWCFFFRTNKQTTQLEINTTGTGENSIQYNFENNIIGNSINESIETTEIKIMIVEIDPSYNDYYLSEEMRKNFKEKNKKYAIKKRNGYCIDFLKNKEINASQYYHSFFIKFNKEKEKYNDFINYFTIIENHGRYVKNKTEWKIKLSTYFLSM